MANNSARMTWTIVAIVIGSLSLAVAVGLTVGYCKLSKREEMTVSLIDTENPVDYV